MNKILFFDTETTGLDAVGNDIIQLAGIIYFDEEIKETFDIRMQPFRYDNIQQKALETHEITIEEMQTYQTPYEGYKEFCSIMNRWCDKYNKQDKMYIGGYNVRFDVDMLAKFFEKCGDKYLGSYVNWKTLDPFPMLHYLDYAGKISLPNYKLGTVCEYFGIEIKAHDAVSDIQASKQVLEHVLKLFKEL